MPKVDVNGCDIYFEVHGQGDPLVMIMGLRRNMEWWFHQLPVLSKHFKVIAFDNRGAGRSDKPELDYSIQLFADDTAALMDEMGIDLAHVLGISMGGSVLLKEPVEALSFLECKDRFLPAVNRGPL